MTLSRLSLKGLKIGCHGWWRMQGTETGRGGMKTGREGEAVVEAKQGWWRGGGGVEALADRRQAVADETGPRREHASLQLKTKLIHPFCLIFVVRLTHACSFFSRLFTYPPRLMLATFFTSLLIDSCSFPHSCYHSSIPRHSSTSIPLLPYRSCHTYCCCY